MRALSRISRRARLGIAAGSVAVVMLAAGCATVPPAPTSSLTAAKAAIANAERADASRYAGAELGAARQKLAQADRAVAAEDMVVAQRLAEQSRVEADLALARTEEAKATDINQEMKRGADALTEEMQRSGGQE